MSGPSTPLRHIECRVEYAAATCSALLLERLITRPAAIPSSPLVAGSPNPLHTHAVLTLLASSAIAMRLRRVCAEYAA